MSAIPERAHNVESMVEFLMDTYRFIRRGDRYMHAALKEIEGRLYALRLAEDPYYRQERRQIQEMIDAEALPEDKASFEEVASKYSGGTKPG